MWNVLELRCVECGAGHDPEAAPYVCPGCGGNLDVVYDYARVAGRLTRETLARDLDFSLVRYAPLLPIESAAALPPLRVGGTPLYHVEPLGRAVGVPDLWIKDDGRNPTASLKDRASAVAVAKAREGGAATLTCASTGNAASSLAGLCASAGLGAVIFVPETAPRAKIAQLLMFGAQVKLVRGSYDQAFDLCLDASRRFGWYSRNTGYNPYLSEGKKTAALEIAEQLGWRPPDRVLVSMGDGNIIGALHKGFRDLVALGLIERVPRLTGVQASGAAPLARAVIDGGAVQPIEARTTADSICVGRPRDATKALRAMRESGGGAVIVSDDAIAAAARQLAAGCGVFAEPAAAAAFAGLLRLRAEGRLAHDERVVVLVTGNGLKDIDAALRGMTLPPAIDP